MPADLAVTPEQLPRAPGCTAPYADLIGKPFAWKGRGPDAYDCYGLVEEMARRCGMKVPDYHSPTVTAKIAELIAHSMPFWTRCMPGPGAIVTLRVTGGLTSHVGFVLPFGRMLHAWEPAGGVCVESLQHWHSRVTGFFSFPQ